jgi:hypothetical protein
MSTKFEQLLDFLVNEEHEKANELFHEIVVEKSREIYENLIAEEEDEEMDEARAEDDEEEMDESKAEDDEEMDESKEEDDEEMDESTELEDSYGMEADDGFGGGDEHDATDELGQEIGAEHGDEEDEKSEDDAIFDIKNAIQELEAAFAELEKAQGDETGHEFGDEDGEEMDDQEDEMMGLREYRETVGNDWDKNSQKTDGQIAGENSGEKMPTASSTKSTVNLKAESEKPTSGANAKNIAQASKGEGAMDGTSPNAKVIPNSLAGGVKGEFTKGVEKNIASSSTAKMKDGAALNKQGSGYPNNNKSAGPVGSGTSDKAGQTSVSNDKSLLKHVK